MHVRQRKIVQLITQLAVNNEGKTFTFTMALADDGSAWELMTNPMRWSRLPDLPQAIESEPEAIPSKPEPIAITDSQKSTGPVD